MIQNESLNPIWVVECTQQASDKDEGFILFYVMLWISEFPDFMLGDPIWVVECTQQASDKDKGFILFYCLATQVGSLTFFCKNHDIQLFRAYSFV